MSLVPLPTINVGATQPIQFDFTDDLAEGETIVTPTIDMSVWSGTDASPSGNFFSTISSSGAIVSQRVRPKTDALGNIYQVVCKIATTLGNVFQKQGLLAVPPATDENIAVVVPGDTVANYDSGSITSAFSPTPVLLAPDNAGGIFTINTYINVSVAGASGTISLTVYWTDNTTGVSSSRTAGTVQVGTTNNSGTTFAIDSQAGSQVLLAAVFNTVVGTPTYSVAMSVSRP